MRSAGKSKAVSAAIVDVNYFCWRVDLGQGIGKLGMDVGKVGGLVVKGNYDRQLGISHGF